MSTLLYQECLEKNSSWSVDKILSEIANMLNTSPDQLRRTYLLMPVQNMQFMENTFNLNDNGVDINDEGVDVINGEDNWVRFY